MTRVLKRVAERALHVRVLRERWLPHGLDVARALARRAPDLAGRRAPIDSRRTA